MEHERTLREIAEELRKIAEPSGIAAPPDYKKRLNRRADELDEIARGLSVPLWVRDSIGDLTPLRKYALSFIGEKGASVKAVRTELVAFLRRSGEGAQDDASLDAKAQGELDGLSERGFVVRLATGLGGYRDEIAPETDRICLTEQGFQLFKAL